MFGGVDPDSELAKELRMAEEAEKIDAERFRSELVKMTSAIPETPSRTHATKKPAPTPEMKAPAEVKKVARPSPFTNNKDAGSKNKDSGMETPTKRDARAGLDKRMGSVWGEEAVNVFTDTSDNFIRTLLKLKGFTWDRVLDRVTQAREERVSSLREAGKHCVKWLPVDVEQAAEGLDHPIASTNQASKKSASKRSASPSLFVSPSPSGRATLSPSVEAENNRSKKRKTNNDAPTETAPIVTQKDDLTMESNFKSAAPKHTDPKKLDSKKPDSNNLNPKNNEPSKAESTKKTEPQKTDPKRTETNIEGSEPKEGRYKKTGQDNEIKSGQASPGDGEATRHSSFVRFYTCLMSIAEASQAGWKVWILQSQYSYYLGGHGEITPSSPLFIPINLEESESPRSSSSIEGNWVLVVIQADRRWAMVHSSSSLTLSQHQKVKKLLSCLDNPPRKIIFQAPIYQEENDIDSSDGLLLLIAACYRAADHDVPMVVESLQAWRLVMDMLAGKEASGEKNLHTLTVMELLRSDIQSKVSMLSRLAENINKSTKLERDLATLLANSDLPAGMHIAKCAQVFAKLSAGYGVAEVQLRMKRISETLNKAEKINEGQTTSDYDRLAPAMDGLLKALEGTNL